MNLSKAIFSFLTLAFTTSACATTSETMQQYQFESDGNGAYKVVLHEVPTPIAAANEVLVKVHASSLNRRDIMILQNKYIQGGDITGGVPLSDGAGEVISVGKDVTRFEVGDRVAGIFFSEWIDGKRTAAASASARGAGTGSGMLSEMVVSNEEGLVRIPEHLSYKEAATLPCAGVTAWSGLFKYGQMQPNEYVLLEGTGGVSSFGLIFSHAAGAKPIITSSSNEKLLKAKALGAVGTVNYRENEDWEIRVRELSNGVGVDHVLEIGGRQTINKALQAMAFEGHMAVIGGITGFATELPVGKMMGVGANIKGIYVGSRADFEDMNAFITEHQIRPVIDRTFSFEDAPEAFEFMQDGDFMGKIVIEH